MDFIVKNKILKKLRGNNNKFNFGFAVDLMIKDLKIALLEAKSLDLNLQTTKDVLDRYNKLSKNGFGNLDTSSLIKLLK